MDPDVHTRVVAAAQAQGISVSAWLTRSARRTLAVEDGLAAVAEFEAEYGPIPEDVMARARAEALDRRADHVDHS